MKSKLYGVFLGKDSSYIDSGFHFSAIFCWHLRYIFSEKTAWVSFLQRQPDSECGSINMESFDDPFQIRKG